MTRLRYPGRPRPVSPLARVVGQSALNGDDLVALRRRVWRETGIAVIKPDDLADDVARETIVKAANELFGYRAPRVVYKESK